MESRRIKYRLMWSYERELREKRRGWWDDQMARENRGELVEIRRYLSTRYCQIYKSLGETSL